MMLWFIYAVLAMILRTGRNVLNKDILKEADSLTLATVVSLFTFVIYSPVFLFSISSAPLSISNKMVFVAILASGFFNSLGIYATMKALKLGDLSVVIPLRNLVPLFALIWGVMLLGETISPVLIPATVLIVVGAVLLHVDKGLKLSLRRKSSMFALGAAFLYSMAIIADKYVTGFMRPVNYVFFIYILRFGFLLVFSKFDDKIKKVKELVRSYWKFVVVISLFSASGSFLIYTALSLAKVTMVAPILRVEVLFSAIAGGIFFREKNMKVKILAAAMMLIGFVLIIS